MLSATKPQNAGEADEQVWQRALEFQLPDDVYGHLMPPVSDGLYTEMTLPSKNECDHFDWEPGLPQWAGMETSKSSSPESDYSQEYSTSLIAGSMPEKDNTDLVQQSPVCESVKRERDTGSSVGTVTQSQKRPISIVATADQVENDGGRAKKKSKTDADSGAEPRSQLACPFQKQDPHRHYECLKYVLHRIKDVKQHVYRRHKQPDYYCARCGDIFKTADERDGHSRSTNCDNLEVPDFEGISEAQKNRLNKSSSRGLDTQEQWFEMWDIIFPGKPRPSSSWVGSYMEEMVPLLRSLWNHKSSSILARVQQGQTRLLDRPLLEGVVGSIFDCLEDEASVSLGKRARETCSQIQHSLVGGQLPTLTPPSKFIIEAQHPVFAEPHDIFQGINADQEGEFQNEFLFPEA
ncbi:hypothetical protein INS49_013296 [Diaporthe citri]|uniref:uncharacterized protein n=1 Tax=Diaporthe citri TaxID=83186 RepID=UPI001C7FD548|nr:uncharacterized protein INS49_013296 [Diaporthe citri]KAG6357419.1 hypothetical protein INS49_013296 [Diaporthe citri]